MKEISAGVIIYRRAAGRHDREDRESHPELKFLILYHGRGYWNFPKGKIESEPAHILDGKTWSGKEKSWDAAVREVREETGLKLGDLKFRKNFKAYEKFIFQRQKEKIFKIVIFYLAEGKRAEIRLSKEHDGFGWFTYKEAMKLLNKYHENQKVLTQAFEFIKRGGKENAV